MKTLKMILLIATMAVVTVNANAWPWFSPYAYCMGNPISFIDPDGRDVHPADNNAFVMLLNTISPEDREYIVLNENGNDHNNLLRNYIRRARMETVSYFK